MTSDDWERVAELVRRSFTGSRLDQGEQAFLENAWLQEPDRYRVVSQCVRAQERAKIRYFG